MSNVASEKEPETRVTPSLELSVFSGRSYIWMINRREILKYFENQTMRTRVCLKMRAMAVTSSLIYSFLLVVEFKVTTKLMRISVKKNWVTSEGVGANLINCLYFSSWLCKGGGCDKIRNMLELIKIHCLRINRVSLRPRGCHAHNARIIHARGADKDSIILGMSDNEVTVCSV